MDVKEMIRLRDKYNIAIFESLLDLPSFSSDCTCKKRRPVEIIVHDDGENVLHKFCLTCGGVI